MPATQKRQRKKAGRQARQQAYSAARRRRSRRNAVIAALLVGGLVVGISTALSGGGGGGGKKSSTKTASTNPVKLKAVPAGAKLTGDTPCPSPDGSSPRTTSFAKAPPRCIDPAKTYTAAVRTTKGTITIALDTRRAPNTVNNFVVLARYHFYDGIAFHRIVPNFVIQVGDPEETGTGGPGYTFADELPPGGQYTLGAVAMANSGPDTNGSQFFIVSGNGAANLPAQYSLFGHVTEGLDVVNALGKLGNAADPNGRPTAEVKITSITIIEV